MMHPAFRAAYEAVQPIDALYEQRRPVHQLLWCLEFAQLTPEHLATTQAVCDELGIAPIEAF
jgi:fructosamine-3-kinase